MNPLNHRFQYVDNTLKVIKHNAFDLKVTSRSVLLFEDGCHLGSCYV
jgi:hypothetical protein